MFPHTNTACMELRHSGTLARFCARISLQSISAGNGSQCAIIGPHVLAEFGVNAWPHAHHVGNGACYPGGHYWNYHSGVLSLKSYHCNSWRQVIAWINDGRFHRCTYSSPSLNELTNRQLQIGGQDYHGYFREHYSDITWVSWGLKSMATRLFVQPIVLANIKENI